MAGCRWLKARGHGGSPFLEQLYSNRGADVKGDKAQYRQNTPKLTPGEAGWKRQEDYRMVGWEQVKQGLGETKEKRFQWKS